ncbi:ABC transporter permease [Streptomyces sp. JJ38]|uniref:ABC transporter permease n=1 Tax=Streptomyces sp. JJ38 TaxID=2738128 RepID=UPI001C56F9E9|nr:ABC transporter permease [Streptomyces sp. JJ38]MBW1600322.1 ABC transporter permease [Streptomyces sp. JJ38]
MTTAALGRMRALGRAELTLLLRNRSAVFTALLVPLLLVFTFRMSLSDSLVEATALSAGGLVLSGGLGVVLVIAVYANLVSAYVARREELVLKRLRTGESSDVEILGGTALPSVLIGLVQCLLLIAAGVAVVDIPLPGRADVLLLGLLLGTVMMTGLAAATSALTRSPESAQITVMPLMMLSFLGSGLMVPLEVMPDAVADVARLLPLTPVVELVRYGWFGEGTGGDVALAVGLAVAWTAFAVFAVRRWFRWEPRR